MSPHILRIPHKYGEFSQTQIAETKEILRKRIFFLLLVAEDLETKEKFPDIDLETAHTTLLWQIDGFSKLLNEPQEIVTVLSLLEEAKNIIKSDFDLKIYRKLILDAGAKVQQIPETQVNTAE